ncbi:5-methyltetrahydropteroyltriglutamate--homocysteine methyltransferase [Serratia quinivorans]|uniref:5-methyltetrahydropteroyltriglutamate--homocysteine methyltransferase n=1 Tax=Serratia quinivorans TaxID=137545 RepID=A0A379ZCR4_9GAMM|nr:5-methyltetrahydropteroyltriglutamate--homocysteine methyltransferase [Serratia quinivorans]
MGNMTMAILNHTLGFPRVGLRRELKKAQESYWAGNSTQEELLAVGRELRARHWQQQQQAGVDLVPVGDFAWYDHVLTTSLLLGNVPARHQNADGTIDLDTLFRLGRGRAPTGEPAAAAEMTKWFNTNYHYMVPEFHKGQQFKLGWTQLLDEVDEALTLGHKIKPVLLGPVTYLWLGKVKGEPFDRLSLLNDILPVYQQVLAELAKRGVEWVQIDEPALVLELPQAWLNAFKPAYDALQGQVKLLLTTYFDSVGHNLDTLRELPVQGLHVDLVGGHDDIAVLNKALPKEWLLSLGGDQRSQRLARRSEQLVRTFAAISGQSPAVDRYFLFTVAQPDRSECGNPAGRRSEELVRLRPAKMRRTGVAERGVERTGRSKTG